MKYQIVVGLGFGDEGKGLVTSYLTGKAKKPMVVRYNGGHQAGHTVIYGGHRHVFSNFGSGTLQGAPTYWSRFCTFYPSSFLRELNLLDDVKTRRPTDPAIYIHPFAPVTTPFDVEHNRRQHAINGHGSVGMGFGATLQRQADNHKLFVQDLHFPFQLEQKLYGIAKYYGVEKPDEEIQRFLLKCGLAVEHFAVADDRRMFYGDYDLIFEGAQGIMLDMDHGYFPNVTRSHTTSRNATELLGGRADAEIYYVTRSYLTRHGNGYMPRRGEVVLKNNENETNKTHSFQGEFRTGKLDIEQLQYALAIDNRYSPRAKKNLVITCMDQHEIDPGELVDKLALSFEFDRILLSYGPSALDIKIYDGSLSERL